ncbi:MAG TPA: pyridoxal-phosphate dependent enzyme [Acidimicrobiales bacterium]|nr:pyridoxal-phosphate dependent enzyme [Acidimicrobiales bacterium]
MSESDEDNNSWLETPVGSSWPEATDSEENPFIKWRKMLSSWHRAMQAGWNDDDYIALVDEINQQIKKTSGTMFHVTPTGIWENVSPKLPSSILWKDETGNVGGSHKARHLMGLLLHLAVDAATEEKRLAISSCGNAALGAATVAKAVGRPIDVFIPTWANPVVVNELRELNADVHVCDRREGEIGDPCMLRFQEAVANGGLPFGVQAIENPLTLDGGRTIGWELALAIRENPVDDLVIQVGGGALLTSCAIGLIEAKDFGVLQTIPRIWAVQAEGCSPLHRAWEGLPEMHSVNEIVSFAKANEARLMKPWENPSSLATGILDDVTYDWLGVIRALYVTNGGSVVSPEEHIIHASELVPELGVIAEPTGSASVAGVMTLMEKEMINRNNKVAVLITGKSRKE